MENKVAIIDLDSVMFSIGSPNKVLGEDKEPIKEEGKFVYYDKTEEELIASADYWMHHILRKSRATHYIAYIKGKGNFRYEVNSEYKSNRPKESPKWWAFCKEHLIKKWGAIPVNGIEVDDACNITRLAIPNSFMCVIDKDLLNLEGLHYNWRKDQWFKVTSKEADHWFWTDMIKGQSGDGVKGIPSKGEKFAQGLFAACTELREYRMFTLEAYINHFGEYEGIKEFHKNYISLKILSKPESMDIAIPELLIYNRNEYNRDNEELQKESFEEEGNI